jgi:hypothetical protein
VIVIGVLSLYCHSSVWHIANHDISLFAGKVKRVQVVGVKSSSCHNCTTPNWMLVVQIDLACHHRFCLLVAALVRKKHFVLPAL